MQEEQERQRSRRKKIEKRQGCWPPKEKSKGVLHKFLMNLYSSYGFIKNLCKTPLLFSFGGQHPLIFFFLFFNVFTVY